MRVCSQCRSDCTNPDNCTANQLRNEVVRLNELDKIRVAELARLYGVIEQGLRDFSALRKEHDAAVAASRRMSDLLRAFEEEIDRADAYDARPKGGQSVTENGDFLRTPPSVRGRLRWWARAFREALGKDDDNG